jgi:serine/threonine protein kinase
MAEDDPSCRGSLNDFKFVDKLGSGSYGDVWLVQRNIDQCMYAMKEINLFGMSRKV